MKSKLAGRQASKQAANRHACKEENSRSARIFVLLALSEDSNSNVFIAKSCACRSVLARDLGLVEAM